jgi:hypothetical protein
LLFLGASSISTLFARVADQAPGSGGENAALVSRELLDCLVKSKPLMFKPHVTRLAEYLTNDASVPAVEVALQAMAQLAKAKALDTNGCGAPDPSCGAN